MATRTRLFRLLSGIALVVAILAVAVSLLPGWIHNWGATPEEVARRYPYDELLRAPVVLWTHGRTIDAPPDAVWPWIAQLGDDRGGFYSYTFIENLFVRQNLYHNANELLPQFQDPQPGEGLIGDFLKVGTVDPGRYLSGQLSEAGLGWTWLWFLGPAGKGQTRLLVRLRIQTPPELDNPLVRYVLDIGGFVMERRMIEGIADRAEGRTDPRFSEAAEIALWLAALVAGLWAAALFLRQQAWQRPLAVGLAAVLVLLYLTFGQPPLGVRLLLDIALFVGVWWAGQAAGRGRPSKQ